MPQQNNKNSVYSVYLTHIFECKKAMDYLIHTY